MIRVLSVVLLSLAHPAWAQTGGSVGAQPGSAAVAQIAVPDRRPMIEGSRLAVDTSPRPRARVPIVVPNARWDGRGGRKSWTLAAIGALRAHAGALPDIVPADIERWCPAYASAGQRQREAFWVGLTSTLAKHESTYRPDAVGGGGRWFGLVQIAPATARAYECRARTGEALKDPHLNLSCALRIMAETVSRDGVISQRMRGVAADWGPFHSRRKREDMRTWLRSQSYCSGLARSLRPISRPETVGIPHTIVAPPPAATEATSAPGDQPFMTEMGAADARDLPMDD